MGKCVSSSRRTKLEKGWKNNGKKLMVYLFRLKTYKNSKVNGVITRHYFAQVSVHTKRSLSNFTQRQSLHCSTVNLVTKTKRIPEIMANTNVTFTLQLGRWRHQANLGFTKTVLNDTMLQNSCVVCNFSHTTDLTEICPFLYSNSHCIQNLVFFHFITQALRFLSKKDSHKN
jgi:hypothetical protein